MTDNYEIRIMAHENCGHCAHMKEGLKDKIAEGRVKILDVAKDEDAYKLAQKLQIDAVPTPILYDKITGTNEVCKLSSDLKKIICKDKEVNI